MTGFEGRVLEATSALLQSDPELTSNAGLNLGKPSFRRSHDMQGRASPCLHFILVGKIWSVLVEDY